MPLMDAHEPISNIELNENQRRHYEVLLTRLEDSLAKIESLLSTPRPQQLTEVVDDLSPAFRAHAESEVPRIRRQVERMAQA